MRSICLKRGALAFALVLALGAGPVAAQGPAAHDGTNATYWMQNAVEYKANAAALFVLAQLRLDQALADKSWTGALEQGADYQGKPPAVILDVDETVLDNSLYQAWLVEKGQSYSSKTWGPFVKEVLSKPIPGSVEFCKYAAAKGVTVFYVTNRKNDEEEATRANLAKFGYPVDDKIDVVLARGEKKEWGSDKGTRRAEVAKTHRVLLQIGDNLGDFVDGAEGSRADRIKLYQTHMARWGKDWIMLANPAYGSWEGAAIGGKWGAPDAEKRQMKFDIMEDWSGPK